MSRFVNNLFGHDEKSPRRSRPKKIYLEVETLEERAVPTVVFSPRFGAETLASSAPFTTLSSPAVNLIFWGKFWGTAAGTQQANALRSEAVSILGSSYFKPLSQYGSDGNALFAASFIDSSSDPSAGYSAGNTSSADEVQKEIASVINNSASGIAGPSLFASQTTSPIYAVVVDPAHSDTNGGYNIPGTFVQLFFVPTPINMISIGTSSGNNMGLFFALTFSHEMAERMTDPTGDTQGVAVNPPAGIPSNLNGGLSQIGDNEPEPGGQVHYFYRLPSGVAVQPYWSNRDSAFVVADGTSQRLTLAPVWTVTNQGTFASFSGHYNLTITGDQFGANTSDTLTIDDDAASGTHVTLNGERFFFDANTLDSITVNLGGGNDTINIEGTTADDPITINLGSGADSVNISPSAKDLDAVQGNVKITGGTGVSTLTVNNQNATAGRAWDVTGSSISRTLAAAINYSNVTNVVLHGGKGGDTFTLSPTAQDLGELPGASNGFLSLRRTSLTIDGGSGSSTLILDDQNNTNNSSWLVAGDNVTRSYDRSIGRFSLPFSFSVSYSNVANLELHAGKGDDTISLSPTAHDLDELPGTSVSPLLLIGSLVPKPLPSLTVDGGTGSDTLILNDQNNLVDSSWSINGNKVTRFYIHRPGLVVEQVFFSVNYSSVSSLTIEGGKGNNTFVVSSTPPGQLTVDGGAGVNKLETDDADHKIAVTGHNAGNYSNVSFVNIASLVGGTGVDVFTLVPQGQLDGTINGGGAPAGEGDWLNYSARTTAVIVDLATGSATSVGGGVSNIQNVIGSAGDDILTGNALGNILIGGATTNLLTGGSGRSLLIAGKGTSTLVGGAADDLLIAGSTAFDSNTSALMSILEEWQRTDKTYAERITDLRNGGGFNGSAKLIAGSTVQDNDGVSTLTGGAGLDWFFAQLTGAGVRDTITDLNAGGREQLN